MYWLMVEMEFSNKRRFNIVNKNFYSKKDKYIFKRAGI